MVALAIASVRAIIWVEVYVFRQLANTRVQVEPCSYWIVYSTELTALLAYPVWTAMASTVSVALTVIGPAYLVEVGVGAVPLVV